MHCALVAAPGLSAARLHLGLGTAGADVKNQAGHEARKQRLGFAHLLRADESKAPTSADIMRVRRIMATAAERSNTYDHMLSEPDA